MGIQGSDPAAMDKLAGQADHTSATILAIRTILDGIRDDAPVYGKLANKMTAEFESQLLPQLKQSEDALTKISEVLTWNAQEQRHASDSTVSPPTGAKPEYRTPAVTASSTSSVVLARATKNKAPTSVPTFADGLSFAERIKRTQEKIAALVSGAKQQWAKLDSQRPELEAQRTELQHQIAEQQTRPRKATDRDLNPALNEVKRELGKIEEAKQLLDHYQGLQGRNILHYDPTGDGTLVELHGKIDADTKNIAVMVPGMRTDQYSVASTSERAKAAVEQTGGKLAVVVALLGDHPDHVDAASPGHAQALGKPLAELSHAINAEAVQQGAAGTKLTVLGHSYGASIVGEGEKNGMWADRILYVAGAGVGHDVRTPADLGGANPKVERYSMTAPGDPINMVQGLQLPGVDLGHGLTDPDKFQGTTELCTGYYPNDPKFGDLAGKRVQYPWSHNTIFQGKEAWENMLGVMTGGEVKPAQYPNPIVLPSLIDPTLPPASYQPPPECGPPIDIK